MNLLRLATGAISAVNPQVRCTVQVSTGYTIGPDGSQVPSYRKVSNVPVQVQPMTFGDLMKSGGLNIEGTRRKAYLQGNIEGLDRQAMKGGDLITLPNTRDFPGPTVWLVNQVLEHWPDWTAVVMTLQNGS
jgi:hypothetical protein